MPAQSLGTCEPTPRCPVDRPRSDAHDPANVPDRRELGAGLVVLGGELAVLVLIVRRLTRTEPGGAGPRVTSHDRGVLLARHRDRAREGLLRHVVDVDDEPELPSLAQRDLAERRQASRVHVWAGGVRTMVGQRTRGSACSAETRPSEAVGWALSRGSTRRVSSDRSVLRPSSSCRRAYLPRRSAVVRRRWEPRRSRSARASRALSWSRPACPGRTGTAEA